MHSTDSASDDEEKMKVVAEEEPVTARSATGMTTTHEYASHCYATAQYAYFEAGCSQGS